MISADNSASSASGMETVGVAVAIPPPFGVQLEGWRRSIGDPTVDAIPPHITLIPPTEVDPAGREAIEKHLETTAADNRPYRVHLRGTGTFRPVSPVVFVALAEGISGCERLSLAIRTGPLAVELSFPYHPHVTVAHYLPEEAMKTAFKTLAGYEAVFDVTAFSLYEHGVDGCWRRERDFGLTAEGDVAAGRPGGEARLKAAERLAGGGQPPVEGRSD